MVKIICENLEVDSIHCPFITDEEGKTIDVLSYACSKDCKFNMLHFRNIDKGCVYCTADEHPISNIFSDTILKRI